MKKLIAILALGAMVGTSYGDININWRALGGFYKNGQFGVDPNGALLFGGGSYVAMLIWSSDNIVDPLDINNIAGNYTSGNDMYLDQATVTHVGNALSQYGDFANGAEIYQNANYGPTVLQGGYVYMRIFQDTTPAGGEYYYDSGQILLTTGYTGSEAPQTLNGNSDNVNGNELNKLIVPEPSVLAFLGAGALVVAFRRMRKA